MRTRGGSTTAYLIDELNPTGFPQVVEEITGGTVTATYALGEQRTHQTRWESGTPAPSYYGYDAHGNVRLLADSTRVVTDRYEYDAFGNLLNVSGTTFNSFFYTGEQLDPTMNLYNLRARWYGPRAGRFATADRFEGVVSRPNSRNLYPYVENDPVNFQDPSGRLRLGGFATRAAATEAALGATVTPTLTVGVPGGLGLLRVTPIAAAVFCIFKTAGDALFKSIDIIDPFFDSFLPINNSGCRIPDPVSAIPGRERPNAVPAPFDPYEVITEPGSCWEDVTGDFECECPLGSARQTQKLHFDPGIKFNEGPHWDYTDCDGKTWKIWPDGTMTPAR